MCRASQRIKQKPADSVPAEAADVPLIHNLYQAGCRRSLVSAEWDETMWNYELTGKSKNNINRSDSSHHRNH